MKTLYPNSLVARPESVSLNETNIRLGDTVYLQPLHGPKVAGTIIFSSPIFGCTTYTADATVGDSDTSQRLRIRFRLKDIHHVANRLGATH
ncbi:hypothetical protein L1889_08895 [Paenalcaligenes niemegkensis]|uniref:hypothetical protein n=1 Tax=Paenalcaligenes niemegkensis TaxID=2895469 RepID=UPI001EE8491E|nr:hypothetical protein [Paenalcaligenes niemegkensis]MCQ9616806.1 hypothetical protein [Paenalcaligenes niemegkensis]